jgi:hypothetical protein
MSLLELLGAAEPVTAAGDVVTSLVAHGPPDALAAFGALRLEHA